MSNTEPYCFYSDPTKEVDYDPPEFRPPTDLDSEDNNDDNNNSDTTAPNMYEKKSTQRTDHYPYYNHCDSNDNCHHTKRKKKRKTHVNPWERNTNNVPVTPSGSSDDNNVDTPTPSPPSNMRNTYCARRPSPPSYAQYNVPSINDNGHLERDSIIMLKVVNRIEKRQTKIDKNRSNIKEHQRLLSSQRAQFIEKLEFDKRQMRQEFKRIEAQFDKQYNIKQQRMDDALQYFNEADKELKKIHKQTVNSVWNVHSDRKQIKKEAFKSTTDFDKGLKKIQLIKPCLEYDSFLAKRYAQYQDIVENHNQCQDHIVEDVTNVITNVNSLIFIEGRLRGVVPMSPDRISVTMTVSYKEEERKNEEKLSDVDTEISTLSERSGKLEMIKNIRVMFDYNDTSTFHRKSVHVLEHEVVIEFMNTKPIMISVKPPMMNCEWPLGQHLKIYEGMLKIRSKNENGWGAFSESKKFRFDENGAKLPI